MPDEVSTLKERLRQLEAADGSLVTPRVAGARRNEGVAGQALLDVPSITWSNDPFEYGPVLFTDFTITLYETGDWKTSCNVKNRSEHSDLYIWVNLFVESVVLNPPSTVFWIPAEDRFVWAQQADHGGESNPFFPESASGFQQQVRDDWSDIAAGRFRARAMLHRTRTNS